MPNGRSANGKTSAVVAKHINALDKNSEIGVWTHLWIYVNLAMCAYTYLRAMHIYVCKVGAIYVQTFSRCILVSVLPYTKQLTINHSNNNCAVCELTTSATSQCKESGGKLSYRESSYHLRQTTQWTRKWKRHAP